MSRVLHSAIKINLKGWEDCSTNFCIVENMNTASQNGKECNKIMLQEKDVFQHRTVYNDIYLGWAWQTQNSIVPK